jgi:predicted LPLAT superfamily acyltransferase
MTEKSLVQEWTIRPERGSPNAIRLGVKIALLLGRRASRIFLYPICLYFLLSSPSAARASHTYLTRVFGRPARVLETFRHFLTFAACLLDRVFLLNERVQNFDIKVHNEGIVSDIQQAGAGCLLFGAHFGSFEAARAVGRTRAALPISLLMYEENARKIRAALSAINPSLETEVLGLGRADSLIAVADRLNRGHFVGVLADRNFDGKNLVKYEFLGAPAAFPRGPFQVALMLRRPIILMVGRYRGGRSYEVIFETLAEATETRPKDSDAWVDATMRRYVERLEYYCRQEPYNWFNFYDFWR